MRLCEPLKGSSSFERKKRKMQNSFSLASPVVPLCNPATVQPCPCATLQQCNPATVQPCNSATLPLCNPATVQPCPCAKWSQRKRGHWHPSQGCHPLRSRFFSIPLGLWWRLFIQNSNGSKGVVVDMDAFVKNFIKVFHWSSHKSTKVHFTSLGTLRFKN